MMNDKNNNPAAIRTGASVDQHDDDDLANQFLEGYWSGHSHHSTIEVEMKNPLEGKVEDRLQDLFTVVNEIIEAGWPSSL